MWTIERRAHAIREWEALGTAADLKAAAELILTQEKDISGGLFFCCYVDWHSDFAGKTDSDLLSRFEYRTGQWLYLVTRIVQ